jgi:hypothetical protein
MARTVRSAAQLPWFPNSKPAGAVSSALDARLVGFVVKYEQTVFAINGVPRQSFGLLNAAKRNVQRSRRLDEWCAFPPPSMARRNPILARSSTTTAKLSISGPRRPISGLPFGAQGEALNVKTVLFARQIDERRKEFVPAENIPQATLTGKRQRFSGVGECPAITIECDSAEQVTAWSVLQAWIEMSRGSRR